MSNFWQKQPSSRILLSQATAITSGTISQSLAAAFGSQTRQIRVASTLSCWIRVGDGAQTAVAGDTFLPTGVVDYLAVNPGQTLAFISTSTSSGYFSCSEMA